MENGAFTASPTDSPASGAAETAARPSLPLEMKTHQRPGEEKQPLCQCDTHCACLEEGRGQAAGRRPRVTVKAWSRTKTVVMAAGVVALVVWCGVMAAMYHCGLL